jgi:hypothetical protein
MAKGIIFTNDLLKLIFNATPIALIADNAASTPLADLYAGLYLSDPVPGGDQTSQEISYTGYARVAVLRTSGGFTVTGLNVVLTSSISFGLMTAGTGGTATFWGVGSLASGAGLLIYSAPINPTLAVITGVTPELTPYGTRVPAINF